MVTYIATVFAKRGHEADVAKFYQDLEPIMSEAKGFRGRQILQAEDGTMVATVRKHYTEEELSAHPEAPGIDGVHFIIFEHWDNEDDRILFSKNVAGGRNRELIPPLHPEHTHEFYKDITPA